MLSEKNILSMAVKMEINTNDLRSRSRTRERHTEAAKPPI